MADLQIALMTWLERLRASGLDADNLLEPPAPSASIDDAERAIGFTFSDDLRALYRHADGQRDIGPAMDATAQGPLVCPLFGGYEFLPLGKAVAEYQVWADVLASWNDGEDVPGNPHAFVTRRDSDPVAADYWRPGWLPFARDGGGNAYAVDFAPASGGTYGQLILFGPDEDERRVLAPGIAVLLATAARHAIAFTEERGNARWFELEAMLG